MRSIDKFLNSGKSIQIVLFVHFLIWIVIFQFIDIHPDMADHWVWSRFLAFGYYEHPPMVALTMRLATLIGGSNIITLKLGSVLFSVLILWTAYKTAELYFDKKAALIFVLILESTLYFTVGSTFWHIDQPYMICWLLGLYIVGRYIKSGNINWIFMFGIVAGLGALSKYIMILFPVCLLIWTVINSDARKLLLSWQTYVSAIIALSIAFPNIYWNYQNDWTTFIFVLEKGLTGSKYGEDFIQFFFAQFLMFSVVYAIYFWWCLLKKRITPDSLFKGEKAGKQGVQFLIITALTPMIFFTITSFKGSLTDPHWVNITYFSAFMLLGKFISIQLSEGNHKTQFRLFVSSYLINILFITIVFTNIQFRYLPSSPAESLTLKKLVGWNQTVIKIEQAFQNKQLELPAYVISREYQTASVLSLYAPQHPIPHSIEKATRNVWSPVNEVIEKGAFLVCRPRECNKLLPKAEQRFDRKFDYLDHIQVHRFGNKIKDLKIYYFQGKER